MSIEIVSMSPKAVEVSKTHSQLPQSVYPFDKLEAGQSFTVPKSEAKLGSLRAIASRKSKGGKRFVVIQHEEPALVEVARLA